MGLSVHILWLGVAFLVLFSLLKTTFRRPTRTFDEMFPYLRDANLEDVRDLVDPADEGYLRLNLSAHNFRNAQHDRLHLFRELLERMSHNAGFLQDWASSELERSLATRNRGSKEASRQLIELCMAFRLAAFVARFRLLLWSVRIRLLPFVSIPCLAEAGQIRDTDLLYVYGRIRETAGALSRACGDCCAQRLSEVL